MRKTSDPDSININLENLTAIESCPKCSSPVWIESVDVEVGILHGPYGCPECGWSEWEEYDISNGTSQAQLNYPNYLVDQWGRLHPNVIKNLSET